MTWALVKFAYGDFEIERGYATRADAVHACRSYFGSSLFYVGRDGSTKARPLVKRGDGYELGGRHFIVQEKFLEKNGYGKTA